MSISALGISSASRCSSCCYVRSCSHNQPEAALDTIDQGLAIVSHNCERFFEAELYRLKARALLLRGAPDTEVESCSTKLCGRPAANGRDRSSFARQPTWQGYG